MHTPGPWEALFDEDFVDVLPVHIDSKDGVPVACAYRLEADAHLIAAAPELLEVLQELLREADEGIATCPLTRSKAHAAIAKATGETA